MPSYEFGPDVEFDPFEDDSPVAPQTKVGTALHYAAQAPTFGFGDEILGGLGAGYLEALNLMGAADSKVPGYSQAPLMDRLKAGYEGFRDQERQNLRVGMQQNPGTAFTSEVGTAIVSNPIKAAMTLPGRLAQAFGQGSLYGLGTSDSDLTSDNLGDALKGGGGSAAATLALETIGNKLGRPASALYNRLVGSDVAPSDKQVTKAAQEIGNLFEQNPGASADELAALATSAAPKAAGIADPTILAREKLLRDYGLEGFTPGDITRSPTLQAAEDQARMGVQGPKVQAVATEAENLKQRSFGEAVAKQRAKIGGQQTVLEKGQGAKRVADRIYNDANTERQIYKQAYDDVGELGVNSSDFINLAKTAKDDLRLTHYLDEGIDSHSQAFKQLNALENVMTNQAKASGSNIVDLKAFEGWRKGLNSSYASAKRTDPDAARALNIVRNQADGFLDHMVDQGLYKGDQAALEQLKKARTLTKEWHRKYEAQDPNDYGKKFVESIVDDYDNALANGREPLTNEQLVNKIFGASKIGFDQKAPAVIGELKKRFGAESPEFFSLKLEAADRILKPLIRPEGGIGTQAAPMIGTYKTNLDNFLKESPTLAKSLFRPQEIQVLRDLGDVGTLGFTKVQSKINPSGSGYTANSLFGAAIKTALRQIPGADLIGGAATGVKEAVGDSLAARKFAKSLTPEGRTQAALKANLAEKFGDPSSRPSLLAKMSTKAAPAIAGNAIKVQQEPPPTPMEEYLNPLRPKSGAMDVNYEFGPDVDFDPFEGMEEAQSASVAPINYQGTVFEGLPPETIDQYAPTPQPQAQAPAQQPLPPQAQAIQHNPSALETLRRLPRGIRNNNPGNIRASSTSFRTYDTPEQGLGAMAKLLQKYQDRDGLSNIAAIVSKYAPPSENDTGSYINTVSANAGLLPTQKLNLRSPDHLIPLMKAMVTHENGFNPYPDEFYHQALAISIMGDAMPSTPKVVNSAPKGYTYDVSYKQ